MARPFRGPDAQWKFARDVVELVVPEPFLVKLNKYKAVPVQLPYYPWSPSDIAELTEDERTYYLEAIRSLRKEITGAGQE